MSVLANETVIRTDLAIESEVGSGIVTVSFRHDGKTIAIDLNSDQVLDLSAKMWQAVSAQPGEGV